MGKRTIRVVGSGVLALLLSTQISARADFGDDVGMGTAALLAHVVYMRTKLVYASLCGFAGSYAYLLTDRISAAAAKVWVRSLGGNYVLNPDDLRGEEQTCVSAPLKEKQRTTH